MKKWLTSLLILLFCIPTFFVLSQETLAPSLEITGANASDLPVITITTNILDITQLPVEGLTPENFTLGGDLADNATIISVENITADDLPFASVLVIDTSTSMSGLPIQLAKEAATLFVQSVGDNDPIAIVSFANRARLMQDYTTDKDQLLSVIDNLQVGGQTALYDGATFGIEVAAMAPVSRRAVVLLSDGAEFGGRSANLREVALDAGIRDGVSVYTIGLGFGTDRSYLEDLAFGTNARSFESPSPTELTAIYAELATLFRTQYVITLDSTIEPDGTVYEFTLTADTPSGTTNTDTGTIRAPVPVPIVRLDNGVFEVPFSSPVTVTPEIVADDEITEITVTIDDTVIETDADGTFTIDPLQYPPASYVLTISATDADGDSGSDTTTFETAALASDISLDFAEGTTLTEPTTLTISADGQTPATTATYTILQDGESVDTATIDDAVDNFPYTIDPFNLSVGDYELFVGVVNEGGATANITVPFSVASVPPRNIEVTGAESEIASEVTLTVAADTQAGTRIADVIATLDDGTVLEDLTIVPERFAPGTRTITVTVTDNNDAATSQTVDVQIAALPPRISFGVLPQPIESDTVLPISIQSQTDILNASYNFDDDIDIALQARADGTYPNIPITLQMFSETSITVNVSAANNGGESTTASITLDVILPATPTPTPDLTQTAEAEIAIATANAVATTDAQSTVQAESEANAQATADSISAQATVEIQSTLDAQSTTDANTEATAAAQAATDESTSAQEQATLDAQSTLDSQATGQAVATNNAVTVEVAQATAQAQADNDAQATEDAQDATRDAAQAITDSTATVETQLTADAATEVAANIEPSATATDEPTEEPTVDLLPTLTPVEILEVDTQAAENPPNEGNFTWLILPVGALAIAIILLLILWFGGRNREERDSSGR